MVETARQNLPIELLGRIDFRNGTARSTGMQDSSVEVVLNRHSVVDVPEIARVLRPGGLFISQHVGERNLAPLSRRSSARSSTGISIPRSLGIRF